MKKGKLIQLIKEELITVLKEPINEARWKTGEKITITTKRGETYTGTVELASPLVLRTGPKEDDVIMKFGRDVKKVVKESINEAYDLKKVLNKWENAIFSDMIKYRKELPDDVQKDFRNLRDAFFKGLDSIVKKLNLDNQ